MSQTVLARISTATAAEVCARYNIKKDALALLRDGMTPGEFLEALRVNNQWASGIDFIAHALPRPEGIWWASLCLQHAYGEQWPEPDKAACRAALLWVSQPGEENRVAAQAPAAAAGPLSPAGILAAGVYQSGGNLAPPKAPPVAPPPFATEKAVGNAIKIASTKAGPSQIAELQRLFLDLGISVASGRVV